MNFPRFTTLVATVGLALAGCNNKLQPEEQPKPEIMQVTGSTTEAVDKVCKESPWTSGVTWSMASESLKAGPKPIQYQNGKPASSSILEKIAEKVPADWVLVQAPEDEAALANNIVYKCCDFEPENPAHMFQKMLELPALPNAILFQRGGIHIVTPTQSFFIEPPRSRPDSNVSISKPKKDLATGNTVLEFHLTAGPSTLSNLDWDASSKGYKSGDDALSAEFSGDGPAPKKYSLEKTIIRPGMANAGQPNFSTVNMLGGAESELTAKWCSVVLPNLMRAAVEVLGSQQFWVADNDFPKISDYPGLKVVDQKLVQGTTAGDATFYLVQIEKK